MMTCVVFPQGIDFSDELYTVLRDAGLAPDPRHHWREVKLNLEEVHELEERFGNENIVFPDLPEALQRPFLVFNLNVSAEYARLVLKDQIANKPFMRGKQVAYGHDILLHAETSREEAVLADWFRPVRQAA